MIKYHKPLKVIKNLFNLPSSKLYMNYSNLCKENGILNKYIILSFDCDTKEDAEAALKIVKWFNNKNLPSVWAVPGRRLEESLDTYKKVLSLGGDFINHGYLDHTSYDIQLARYYSITWYHEMSFAKVREDIIKAHNLMVNLLNVIPKGFRAPHFGYFQSPKQLEIIYNTISELNYTFATTTVPKVGLKRGGFFPVNNKIKEFPVSGTFDKPQVILDSWQFFAAPERKQNENDFLAQFTKTINFFSKNDLPGVLNYYVDPSHVVESEIFYSCLLYSLNNGFEFTSYSKIFSLINK